MHEMTRCTVAFEIPEGRDGEPDVLAYIFDVPVDDFGSGPFWDYAMSRVGERLREQVATPPDQNRRSA